MEVAVAVAQTPVTWDISQNLATITSCLAGARADEIVVLPEACVSGYDDRLSGLDDLDPGILAQAVDRLAAGSELPVLQLRLDGGSLAVGVRLCREILFPEQWRYLAEAGAQAFIYLTNAVNPAVPAGVWSSHLISHAAVNQRFVIACNIADPGQHCPSMILSPRGEVLGDLPAGPAAGLRAVLDTEDVSDWYLSQRRTDVLRPARE